MFLDVFPSKITEYFFYLLFVLVLIIELSMLRRNRLKASTKGDKFSLTFVLIGVLVPVALSIYLSYLKIGLIDNRVSYFGLLFIIIGFLVRQWSIYVLGKHFILIVGVNKGQRVIMKGPYKYVRHPSYLGLFFEVLGGVLALSNFIGVILVIVLFIPSIFYRINIEEEFLERNLKGYNEYKNKTYRLIPFVY